jgi:hypothetical protein
MVPATCQLGMCFHAGASEGAVTALRVTGACVASLMAPASAGRSLARPCVKKDRLTYSAASPFRAPGYATDRNTFDAKRSSAPTRELRGELAPALPFGRSRRVDVYQRLTLPIH